MKYEGEWLEDKFNGKGKLTKPGEYTYEGFWYNDIKKVLGLKCGKTATDTRVNVLKVQ